MPVFLEKARHNVKVSGILIEEDFCMASAHPAYYSAFLLLKYVMAHYMSVSYECQDCLTNNKDSHKTISQLVLPYLRKVDPIVGNNYLEWYNKLKMLRNKADYRPGSIGKDILSNNFVDAKAFLNSIERHFNLV